MEPARCALVMEWRAGTTQGTSATQGVPRALPEACGSMRISSWFRFECRSAPSRSARHHDADGTRMPRRGDGASTWHVQGRAGRPRPRKRAARCGSQKRAARCGSQKRAARCGFRPGIGLGAGRPSRDRRGQVRRDDEQRGAHDLRVYPGTRTHHRHLSVAGIEQKTLLGSQDRVK